MEHEISWLLVRFVNHYTMMGTLKYFLIFEKNWKVSRQESSEQVLKGPSGTMSDFLYEAGNAQD